MEELYLTFLERVKRKILTEANIFTGMEFCAALAQDNIAGNHMLAAVLFDTEALAVAVAAVFGSTLSFFVCHGEKYFWGS